MADPIPTFEMFALTWRTTLQAQVRDRHLRRSTAAEYGQQYARHVAPRFGGIGLDVVTAPELDDWLRHLLGAGMSPNSVAVALAAVRHLLNAAVRAGHLIESPAYRLQTKLKRQQVSREPIPAFDIGPIVDTMRQWRPVFADVTALSSQIGTRIGEVMGLRVADVRLDAGAVIIRRSWHDEGYDDDPKNGEARTVPLTEAARALLRPYLDERAGRAWIFANPDTGNPYGAQTVRRWFVRALDTLRMPRAYKLHCLRHSFGTELVSAGVPEPLVGRYMGHRDPRMTRGYTRTAKPPCPPEFHAALHFLQHSVRRPVRPVLVPQGVPRLRLVPQKPLA